ncbi:MAG: FAD-dependent oxidoreductase [Planctomycetaceae bacterium]
MHVRPQGFAKPTIIVALTVLTLAYLSLQTKTTVDRGGPGRRSQPGPQPANGQIAADAARQGQRDTDVLIVGAGISGLSAALDLGRSGARVTVIDMSSVFGGHAVMSQGGVSIVDTPTQVAAGIRDSAELATDDFLTWGEDAHVEWVKYYVRNSRHTIYDWLTELGVRFESVESAPGNSVNRFHQPSGRGIGLVTPIYRACLAQPGIRFEWNTRADQLLTADERVIGLKTRNLRTHVERDFRARAVILATGGFQSNLDMVREFWPGDVRFPERILAGSGRNSIGLGHKLAQSVGGALVKMNHQWNYFTGIPDPRQPDSNRGLSAANMWGIIVNAQGRRFANLHNWAKEVTPAMLAQTPATLWFVFDERSKPKFVVSGSDWADFDKVDRLILQNTALVKSAETIEKLARLSGLPVENLTATLQRYNALVDEGVDHDFGRFGPGKSAFANEASPRIDTGPYYAMQAYTLTRKSMGGVAIDLNCRVIDKRGQTIPGLLAVGELTGLAGINGKAALEGTFLGPCIVTGRVAARTILDKLTLPPESPTSAVTSCTDCHDIESQVKQHRNGHWHFEQSHTIVLQRGTDCRQCHAELAPYRENQHVTQPLSLSASCVRCHTASE